MGCTMSKCPCFGVGLEVLACCLVTGPKRALDVMDGEGSRKT